MKKRSLILILLIIGSLIAGCADNEAGQSAMVEELPIEQESTGVSKNSPVESKVAQDGGLECADEDALYETKKEPYEEVDVEVNGDKGVIIVGTTGAPYTELLTQVKSQLAKDGWDVRIEKYDDYQKINEDVLNGTLDAHLFAHQTYIDSYNDVNGTNLVAVDKISYEVYGIYSALNQDLTQVFGGAAIGIPQDAARKARALLFMQDIGWITLKEEVGITAILDDITENPKNLQFKEYTQDTISQVMNETEYCVIGADMAIVAGLDPEKSVLKTETDSCDSVEAFVSLLITSEENMQQEKIRVLATALKSAQIKTYVEETYRGALAVYK